MNLEKERKLQNALKNISRISLGDLTRLESDIVEYCLIFNDGGPLKVLADRIGYRPSTEIEETLLNYYNGSRIKTAFPIILHIDGYDFKINDMAQTIEIKHSGGTYSDRVVMLQRALENDCANGFTREQVIKYVNTLQ